MTTESNKVKPSSSTRVGIFDSGLSCMSRSLGLSIAATDRTSSSRSTRSSSWAQTMTLRTYGDFGDQCNFIAIR